ncbi:uncharacterized protein LACBIDRAFT_332859 [Laccaria bicolor S238N-H82]|uniref:Predicted protein n=1 Tax=Laccaria bicolor (strain S238N-H82 / ATCC MYA-4686) TaxID=486041 RepID=B0DU34_LACBS|nr:uncharacterized protein LACBIDRAFT_332859 [Laccaria bicolor S238N-H82]EDR01834.1 predicted protein [Laccaria bicolor S238N-H82]|eukprot:XP_001887444.1 predicted protein [Laccaria bicolor S238N-H82]
MNVPSKREVQSSIMILLDPLISLALQATWYCCSCHEHLDLTDDQFSNMNRLASFRNPSTVVKVIPPLSACASGVPRREGGIILGGVEAALFLGRGNRIDPVAWIVGTCDGDSDWCLKVPLFLCAPSGSWRLDTIDAKAFSPVASTGQEVVIIFRLIRSQHLDVKWWPICTMGHCSSKFPCASAAGKTGRTDILENASGKPSGKIGCEELPSMIPQQVELSKPLGIMTVAIIFSLLFCDGNEIHKFAPSYWRHYFGERLQKGVGPFHMTNPQSELIMGIKLHIPSGVERHWILVMKSNHWGYQSPKEFVAAGDFLVYKFPVWTCVAGAWLGLAEPREPSQK